PAAPGQRRDGGAAAPAGLRRAPQRGVITAVVAAITAAGKAARLAMRAKPVRRRTGRASSEGRHSSAAQPAIKATSRMTLTKASAPKEPGWPVFRPHARAGRGEAEQT